MNKKGFLLAEEVMKMILAVIAIGLLAYLLISLYGVSKDSKNLEFAKASLDHLISEIEDNRATSVQIPNPKKWKISSWSSSGDLPLLCSNAGWNSCICVCKDKITSSNELKECDSAGACLENSNEFSISRPIKIGPSLPHTLNIDYSSKEIS
jgi:hypothetical protein